MGTVIPIEMIDGNVVIFRREGDDFIFVDLNYMVEKTEGIAKAALIGRRFTEAYPSAEAFGLLDVMRRVHKTGKSEVHGPAYYRDSRIEGWRLNHVHRLDDGTLAVFYEDQGPTKKLENDLQTLGSIIDNSINEIYIFNSNDLLFTYVNLGASQNIGYSLEEMREMTPVDIKPEYTISDFRRLIVPLIEGSQEQLVFETVHRRKDGSDYNVEIRLQLMERQGKQQFVVIANDITRRKAVEAQLRQSEEHFRSIAENVMVGICIYRPKIVYANQALAEISGYSVEELKRLDVWELAAEPEGSEKIRQVSERRLKGERFPVLYNDFPLRTRNGEVRIVRAMTQTIPYGEGFAGLVTIMDVSDLTEVKHQLSIFAQVVEQTDDLIKITDRDGVMTYVNDALVAKSGYTRKELIGSTPAVFRSGEHDDAFYRELREVIYKGRTFRHTFANRKKDGAIFYEEETITPIMDGERKILYFVATGKDVSERIALEKELTRRATVDMLTKIYNRDEANRQLERVLEGVRRYRVGAGLLMIDLDHFKQVNDEFGHDVGDDVLQAFASLISLHVRQNDIFARWGGEEFIVVTGQGEESALLKFAEKLRELVRTFEFPHGITMSISIGVTGIRPDDTKKSLLKRVDGLLYQAKSEGRDAVCYIP